jgi:hypothetical protein
MIYAYGFDLGANITGLVRRTIKNAAPQPSTKRMAS